MGRNFCTFFKVCLLFTLIKFSSSCISGNQEICKKQEQATGMESLPRDTRREFIPSGLWFGPRLGRRKRKGPESYFEEDGFNILERMANANERAKLQNNVDYLYDIPNIMKTIDAMASKRRYNPRLGRELVEYDDVMARNVNYIPRLGRESGHQVYDDDTYSLRSADDIDVRPPNFSPRLGRTLNFSPRLGRELEELTTKDQLNNSRYTRSTKHEDKTKS